MEPDELLARITAAAQDDPRVLAAWLTGSRGRGTADRHSDIDVWLAVPGPDLPGFLADWPALSDRITPTVLRQQLGGGPVFTAVTPDWLRFDVSVGTPEDVPRRSRTTHRLLFDRAGLHDRLGPPGPPLAPDPARVAALTTEFLRVLGLLPVALGRDDLLVAASGTGLLRQLLIDLMREDTAVEDRGGALRLTALLGADRVRTLTALPPIAATRQSALDGHSACARAFLPLARELHARLGLDWPHPLEHAARRHLRTALGLELGADAPPRIRRREDGDFDACAALLDAVHRSDGYPVNRPARPAAWLTPDGLLGAWVAELDGRPAGHVALARPAGGDLAPGLWSERTGTPVEATAVVTRLFADPRARGRGIGTLLLDRAVEESRRRGLHPVLDVVTTDTAAAGLYERRGWTRLATREQRWSPTQTATVHCYAAPAAPR